MESSSIVLVSGGYDHSIKFWFPHDGVCYRTAQHPESVSVATARPPDNVCVIIIFV